MSSIRARIQWSVIGCMPVNPRERWPGSGCPPTPSFRLEGSERPGRSNNRRYCRGEWKHLPHTSHNQTRSGSGSRGEEITRLSSRLFGRTRRADSDTIAEYPERSVQGTLARSVGLSRQRSNADCRTIPPEIQGWGWIPDDSGQFLMQSGSTLPNCVVVPLESPSAIDTVRPSEGLPKRLPLYFIWKRSAL